MFHYLKSPILHVIFVQNLPTMNILDPIFLSHVVLRFLPSDLPEAPRSRRMEVFQLHNMFNKIKLLYPIMWTSMLQHYWLITSIHFQYHPQICFGTNKLNTKAHKI
jgi:hypothetical protein